MNFYKNLVWLIANKFFFKHHFLALKNKWIRYDLEAVVKFFDNYYIIHFFASLDVLWKPFLHGIVVNNMHYEAGTSWSYNTSGELTDSLILLSNVFTTYIKTYKILEWKWQN